MLNTIIVLASVFLVLVIIILISLWKIFVKAGKPGWAVLVPIYNIIVFLEINGKPWWWIFFLIILPLNIVICIIVIHNLSLSFGKDSVFTVGLLFLPIIFFPILGFGSLQYIGAGGKPIEPIQLQA